MYSIYYGNNPRWIKRTTRKIKKLKGMKTEKKETVKASLHSKKTSTK